MKNRVGTWMAAAGAAAMLAGLSACEVGSPDTAIRSVEFNVAGFYANPDGGNLVSQNTGAAIVNLNLRQTGDQLEGIDNNGKIFRGTIGDAGTSSASITLQGETTAGNPGTISGTIDSSGTTATMRGTWIENSLYGTVYGQATVPTNGGSSGGTLAISPSGNTTVARGSTATFTASGGTTYSWSVTSTAIGTITPTTGSSVTYAAVASGTNTVTVTSGGSTKSTRVITP